MTAEQRVVLRALRDAQFTHAGQAVSPRQVAALCRDPWPDRPDLVSQALGSLDGQGFVLRASGATRGWKITAAGRSLLTTSSETR